MHKLKKSVWQTTKLGQPGKKERKKKKIYIYIYIYIKQGIVLAAKNFSTYPLS